MTRGGKNQDAGFQRVVEKMFPNWARDYGIHMNRWIVPKIVFKGRTIYTDTTGADCFGHRDGGIARYLEVKKNQ